jgi:hypothetical protein
LVNVGSSPTLAQNQIKMKNYCGIIEHDYGCNCGEVNEVILEIKNTYAGHKEIEIDNFHLGKSARNLRRIEKRKLQQLKKNRKK